MAQKLGADLNPAYNSRMSILKKLFGKRQGLLKDAGDMRENPALDYVRSVPQDPITETLIAAFPDVSEALIVQAERLAREIGLTDRLFVECVLDLELAVGLDKAVEFVGDKRLASAYVDAVVFEGHR